MRSFFRSVIFGFMIVSVLGASSVYAASTIKAPVKSAVFDLTVNSLDGELSQNDVAKTAASYIVEKYAMRTATATASALEATASTGTAISTLSGAAAVSATSAVIGAPVSAALGAVGIAVAPAVVGSAIIIGVITGVTYGLDTLLSDD